jgi:hypothetical protein
MGHTIRMSCFFSDNDPCDAKHAWPEECYLQGGRSGIVFEKGSIERIETDPSGLLADTIAAAADIPTAPKHYRTAFVEAFPKVSGYATFIRGEGKTVEDAEDDCWRQYERMVACPKHEFERRGSGSYGICVHCRLGSTEAFQSEGEDHG